MSFLWIIHTVFHFKWYSCLVITYKQAYKQDYLLILSSHQALWTLVAKVISVQLISALLIN